MERWPKFDLDTLPSSALGLGVGAVGAHMVVVGADGGVGTRCGMAASEMRPVLANAGVLMYSFII
jgi:hypothetical protein